MSKSAFNKIKAGLDDAIAFAGGDTDGAVIHVPERMDVRAIRKVLHLNQEAFAARFGFGLARLRDWEQGRSAPDSAVRAYLTVIEKNPKAVEQALGIKKNVTEARPAD